MTYKKELADLLLFIDNFDPEEFTSSVSSAVALPPTPEKLAEVHRLKARLKRNRQVAESFQLLFAKGEEGPEMILTQEDVDAVLEGWTA